MAAELPLNILVSTKNVHFESARRSTTYHPSVWGDYFLPYASNLTELSTIEMEELQKLREEVKKLLATTLDNSLHKMELIDAIQRLGVGYHFEKEIEKSIGFIYEASYLKCNSEENDLSAVALRFRLLRQHGYNVSCDVFNQFKDSGGKFERSLISNVKGMLSLYEAAHFGVHGEEILEEALEFCSRHLESMVLHMSNSLATKVNAALKIPIQKSLTRVEAKTFMSIYENEESHNEIILRFAKLEFNLLQKIHQKELSGITRWWKALNFSKKLPFARDRMVECYFWILGMYFEPQYHLARKILTKIIAMTSLIDDLYDVYGTLGDLQLFTDAIQRWDICALEQLPPYMRICYQALFDVYAEMEEELEKTSSSYRVLYAKQEMEKLVRAYFQEAKWFYNNHIPTMEEYMKVAIVSPGYMMLATTSLVGMGALVVKEDFNWVSSEPLIVRASSVICRLMDDMVGYGFEKKISAVECYMNENDASKEKAFDEFHKQVSKAWKDINQECLHPTVVSMPILMRVVNAARVINLLYKNEDGYTNSKTKTQELIKSVLVEPVMI